jgi:hypothetical protein
VSDEALMSVILLSDPVCQIGERAEEADIGNLIGEEISVVRLVSEPRKLISVI